MAPQDHVVITKDNSFFLSYFYLPIFHHLPKPLLVPFLRTLQNILIPLTMIFDVPGRVRTRLAASREITYFLRLK